MIQLVATGRLTTFCVDDAGHLYAAGNNSSLQLGLSDVANILIFKPVNSLPADKRVINVAAGDDMTLVLLDDNSLWVAGQNLYGYLGLGSKGPENLHFTEVTNLPTTQITINDISVKKTHSMVLFDDGMLWEAGSNGNGELGLGHYEDAIAFTQVTRLPEKRRVVKIAAGDYGNVIQLDDESMLATGNNMCGQLGLSVSDAIIYQAAFIKHKLAPCQQIVVGAVHSILLLEDGSLWGVGDNSKGQLGLKDQHINMTDSETQSNNIPLTQLIIPVSKQPIKKIYAGRYNTFVLFEDGNLWATGNNNLFQLGVRQNHNVIEFTHINPLLPTDKKVCSVAASLTHTVLLLEDGNILCAGDNSCGQLGFGDKTARQTFTLCPTIESV